MVGFDVEDVAGGTGGVGVDVASGIGGAGACGTESVECSSCGASSPYGGSTTGALESGYGCLDDSPGPEVLGLMGGTRHTDGSGGGDISGLRVAYLY
uniref:Uncharacterized protein n=1 Tax=Vitis vinifera TaxID=29760 RepID=A5CA66_VITVI|nr:hypothetical protein VITISV_006055 [Vitis vinifera]